jgi:multidrug transporter EmrE-like cation transporter
MAAMFTICVTGAALSFAVGGYFMKLSQGLSRVGPTALVFVCFGLGAALQTLAMRDEQMTVTYVVVLGLEATAAYLIGALLLDEATTPSKLGGIGLVVAGIMLLRK